MQNINKQRTKRRPKKEKVSQQRLITNRYIGFGLKSTETQWHRRSMQPHVLSAIGARTQSFSFSSDILVSCTHPSSLFVSKSGARVEIVKFVCFLKPLQYMERLEYVLCCISVFSPFLCFQYISHFSDFLHHQRKQQKHCCFFHHFFKQNSIFSPGVLFSRPYSSTNYTPVDKQNASLNI